MDIINSKPIKVFISYSHDSPEHSDRVLALSDRLRGPLLGGIDAWIDQYEESPTEGWPRWMTKQIKDAGYVLVVCTATYQGRFDDEEVVGKGKGAKWESANITLDLYEKESQNDKFIPIIFSHSDVAHIPLTLRGATHYNVSDDDEYEKLYRRLTGQKFITAPSLGKVQAMPRRNEKTSPVVSSDSQLPATHSLPHQARRQNFYSQASMETVPYGPNPFFTGREAVLDNISQNLSRSGRVALSGLPGIGKTQTAVEYAYRHRGDYDVVLWARASSEEAIISDFAAIARALDLPLKDEQDQSLTIVAVKRWLVTHEKWLLILDNADDINLVGAFLPTEKKGHVLLTTRASATNAFSRVGIEKMPDAEGALFLLRRAKIIGENIEMDKAPTEQRAMANAIAIEMDGLPLALEQAGAFIEQMGLGLEEYLQLYREEGAKLLAEPSTTGTGHAPVTVTFSLAFKQVSERNRAAADLIRVCAFLAPDTIPLEIFSKGATELGDNLSSVSGSTLELIKVVGEAGRFSLIHRDATRRTLDIHRLVQQVLIDEMDNGERRLWAQRTVSALNTAFPDVDYKEWPLCERLLPHAEHASRLIRDFDIESSITGRLLNSTGHYLSDRGQYANAEPFFGMALRIREKVLGLEHPDVAQSLNDLSVLYNYQGRLKEEQPLQERALSIRTKTLGKEHRDTLQSLGNLAIVYREQGRYKEAEALQLQALEIRKKTLGEEHPSGSTAQ